MQESQTLQQYSSARSVDGMCRRCDSRNVVLSRHRGIEGWVVNIFPINTYRCVECYSRFWSKEPMFLNSKRIWFWGTVIFLIIIAVFLKMQMNTQPQGLNRTAEFISPFDEPNVVEAEPVVATSGSAELVDTSVLSDSDLGDGGAISVSEGVANSAQDLVDAQEKSEQVSDRRNSSVERLEQAIVDDRAALESLLKVDMNYRVERWRDAWQSGLVDYYLAFYSQNFQPSGNETYNAWVDKRKYLVSPEKKIQVQLSNFDVSFSLDMKSSTVLFDQQYKSKTYSELSRKKIIWVKELDEWKIVSESQVEN